jgi:hypothetical protein
LHFRDPAGDRPDKLDRPLPILRFGQEVRQHLDRQLRLELDDDRLLLNQGCPPLPWERGERLVAAQDLSRHLEAVAADCGLRLREQDQHADDRLLKSRRDRRLAGSPEVAAKAQRFRIGQSALGVAGPDTNCMESSVRTRSSANCGMD